MQQIVVGFTQTETAERALQEAAALAIRLGSTLHVVTSLDDPSVEVVREFGDEFVIDDFENAERAIRRSMANIAEAPDFTVAVLDAKPADALIAEAERLDAEMIVVGNVRMQGPGRVLGSVDDADRPRGEHGARRARHDGPVCRVPQSCTVGEDGRYAGRGLRRSPDPRPWSRVA